MQASEWAGAGAPPVSVTKTPSTSTRARASCVAVACRGVASSAGISANVASAAWRRGEKPREMCAGCCLAEAECSEIMPLLQRAGKEGRQQVHRARGAVQGTPLFCLRRGRGLDEKQKALQGVCEGAQTEPGRLQIFAADSRAGEQDQPAKAPRHHPQRLRLLRQQRRLHPDRPGLRIPRCSSGRTL